MIKHFWCGIFIGLLLILGVFIAGCSDQSPAGNITPVTTTAVNTAKYSPGDIIAKTATSTDQMLYVIVDYDRSKDEYIRQLIYKNSDGLWGHFVTNKTESVERLLVEKVYPFKIAHVQVNTIAIVTPTLVVSTTMIPSGNSPAISSISPTRGATNATVSVAITGNYFQSGATVKLIRPGDPLIQATGVTVSSSSNISGVFKLTGAEKGGYNVIVTNPDGQSDTLVGGFSVGEYAPLITSITPVTGIYNETVPLIITGQYFTVPAKVELSKGADLKICQVTSIAATKILCNLEIRSGPDGEWNITVINIADGQSITWNRPFKVNPT
jgi:hypothetical protein